MCDLCAFLFCVSFRSNCVQRVWGERPGYVMARGGIVRVGARYKLVAEGLFALVAKSRREVAFALDTPRLPVRTVEALDSKQIHAGYMSARILRGFQETWN